MAPSQKLISASDESGVLCTYDQDSKAKPKRRSYVREVLDVFLPAGYPHTVTPDYTPYQIYDSLQAFSSTIAGLLSSRAVLQGFGVGNASSTATGAVLLTVLQESTGRLATILFAHRVGQAIEPECKFYRFLADIFNDTSMILDILSPTLPGSSKVAALCVSGVLKALCGVSGASAKASLSAHFAKSGNLAELNAKDGSQETVISLMGMLVGSVFLRFVQGRLAVWVWTLTLLGIHLWTNYQAVRSVQMRTINRQRANLISDELASRNRILRPDEAAALEGILYSRDWWTYGSVFARRAPRAEEIKQHELDHYRGKMYVITVGGTIYLKDGASTRDALMAWLESIPRGYWSKDILDVIDKSSHGKFSHDEFFQHLKTAGWDLDTGALETGPAVRIHVERRRVPRTREGLNDVLLG
ncbi:DUF647-domain-containing protein [Xylariaceae sp. FL1019]|nr:DUF647-domain-containing protein [Xylariaceae sp. FL1019]